MMVATLTVVVMMVTMMAMVGRMGMDSNKGALVVADMTTAEEDMGESMIVWLGDVTEEKTCELSTMQKSWIKQAKGHGNLAICC